MHSGNSVLDPVSVQNQGDERRQQETAWRDFINAGKLDDAAKRLESYLEHAPQDADALDDLGVVYARQRKFAEAVARFRRVVELDVVRAGTWRNLARAHGDLGEQKDAERCLAKVCELEPKSAANFKARADACKRLERFPDAVAAMEKAVALEPSSPDMQHDLARALADAKRHGDARTAYLRAIELNPDSSEFYNNLAVTCQDLNQPQDAIKYLREAIRLRPGVVGVYNNLGVALNEQRQFNEAIECYNKAIAIEPEYALAWNNLGNSLRAVGRNEAAIAALQTAIRLKPDYPEAFNNLAIAYVQMGENEEALRWYDKALCYRPDYSECHMNRALQRLLLGDLANGWADYEWRWQLKSMRQRDFKKPLWDGSPLGGKKILIYWEQGLGDSIQFIRYARELKDRGATVIFEGQPPLQHILSRTRGIDHFVPRGSELPPFDIHAPLLSLPGQCDTTLENIPSDIPYILPDSHFVNLWKPRLDSLKGLRVGIVWQGNPDHRGDHLRSIPLRLFEPLAKIEGVTLVSLQRNHGVDQLDNLDGLFQVARYDGIDEDVDGFLRTAAIIKNLDLIISADTSVAHLAGAMGVPVWIAIAVASDWRWLRSREDTPWYPTARLFRQREPGDWKEVFERMTAALKERVVTSPRGKNVITADEKKKARDLIRRAAKNLAEEKIDEAQAKLEEAIQLDPRCADAHHDLGVVFGRRGRVSQAIACFRRALELQPESNSAFGNIGLAFLHNRQIPEAIAHLRKAARLGGGSADIYNNLGVALTYVPDAASAEQYFVKALHLRPDFTSAHCNLARALLIQGKFEQGWLEMEWRWKMSPESKRDFPQPRWTGQTINGRTVLLWAESTASDGEIIQFIRYASYLKKKGGHVVAELPPRLARLLATCPDIDEVIPAGSPLPRFEVHAAILSMPAIVGTTLSTIPRAGASYLRVDPALSAKWEPRIKKVNGVRVGIAWDVDPEVDFHGDVGIPLECFSRLSQLGGIKLLSLQKGRARDQLTKFAKGNVVEDLVAELSADPAEALMDMAAIISHLDLVITADNSIAHLACALGKPVWLAATMSPNFRWLLERGDSPWYPTMRIFRQRRSRAWTEIFEQMADELLERVTSLSSATESTVAAEVSATTLRDEAFRCMGRGELAAASERFQQALQLKPDWAGIHHDLAVVLAKQRRFDKAVEHFRRALELDPSSRAYGNLALALLEKGDHAAAVEEIRTILAKAPDSAELNCRLGIALCHLGKYSEATDYLQRAAKLKPEPAEAFYWLGDAYRHQKQLEQAVENLRHAIELRPQWHDAHNLLGLCLSMAGLHDQAIESFRETVRLNRDYTEAWNNLAISLADANRLDEATEAFQRALYLRPDSPETHRNLAITLLLQGRYEQGWLEYEWRLRAKDAPRRKLPGRRWDGASLKGKTILMTAEQGMGDTIQFVRYARLAKERGAKTLVEAPLPLIALFSRCPFIDQVIPAGQKFPATDFHTAMMSAPVAFRTTLQNMPRADPYMHADPDLSAKWKQSLGEKKQTRIGIVWQGNPIYGGDRHRSIALCEFAPIAHIPGVALVSLQKEHGLDQLHSATFPITRLEEFETQAGTFDETAAIISSLDAVVVCDTSVAHLAAAMGKRVYLALATANDWRWMRGRSDSPWYPTLRLFRQSKAGDWVGVFNSIAEEIQKEMRNPS